MGFFPDTLFAFEGGGDDEFSLWRDVAVDTQCLEGPVVLDERQGDHRVKLGDEGLPHRQVFGKGKIEKDHLFPTLLVAVVDEVEDTLLLKCPDRAVEPVFGDTEALFGGSVELVDSEVAGLISRQNDEQGDLLSVEAAMKKGFEFTCASVGELRHQRQCAEFEEVVEAAAL